MNIKISVFSAEKKFEKFEKTTKKRAEKILKTLKIKNAAVEINLINNSKMRLINKKFRGKNMATNILSFVESKNFPHPELKRGKSGPKNRFLGEIYLNINKVADFSGNKSHLGLDQLLAHGLLHLLGYIHNTKNDRMKMERKERGVLSRITTNLNANSTNKY